MEIPGVSNNLLPEGRPQRHSQASRRDEIDAVDFLALVREKMAKLVKMDEALLHRPVNDGFSGGEKKRNEIFHMAVLDPKLAVLDETDSGLDIDALRIVADGVNALRSEGRSFDPVITHYQRLLNYIVPDVVHVLVERPDRQDRRQGAGARARGQGLLVARGGAAAEAVTA